MRLVALVAALTTALGIVPVAAAASPRGAAKPPNPCKVLNPDDLKLVFAQPWRKGAEQVGGACRFERPTDTKWPNIVVAVLVERKASPRKAREAFARGRRASEDITQVLEPIRGLGDEAYVTGILGSEVLSFRHGRDLAEIRVGRVDKPEETYRDQLLALGDIVEARLEEPPKEPKKHKG